MLAPSRAKLDADMREWWDTLQEQKSPPKEREKIQVTEQVFRARENVPIPPKDEVFET